MLTFKTPKTATVHAATLKEKLLHMDPIATVLIMAALACIILPLQYAGVSHAWNSSVVIGLIVGFVAICAALVAVEILQGERAMLTPRIMAKRTVWASGIWGFFFAGAYFVTLYYLPIYFQSIDNVSPIASGVRNIPLIIMFSVATFGSGKAITMTGHATPYMLAGSVFVTVGAGLLYTLDIGTSTGKWVGYQIIAGFGYGLALQVPVVVAQAFAEPADIAPTTAIIICTFFFSLVPPCLWLIISLLHSLSIHGRNAHARCRAIRLCQPDRGQTPQHGAKPRSRPCHGHWCHRTASRIQWRRFGWRYTCVRLGYQGCLFNHACLLHPHHPVRPLQQMDQRQREKGQA